jgi:hypothetical protein
MTETTTNGRSSIWASGLDQLTNEHLGDLVVVVLSVGGRSNSRESRV